MVFLWCYLYVIFGRVDVVVICLRRFKFWLVLIVLGVCLRDIGYYFRDIFNYFNFVVMSESRFGYLFIILLIDSISFSIENL